MFIEIAIANRAISWFFGLVSAFIIYPLAEKLEKRVVRQKVKALRRFYNLSTTERNLIAIERLANIIDFATHHVPYYRDLFKSLKIDSHKIKKDIAYLNDIPYLTKEIIREQGSRMISNSLGDVRHHICKTGGSTGLPCTIYYDQTAADCSAAVTIYSRERVGKLKSRSELHFACRFPDALESPEFFTREDFKSFAMNRTNIFFDNLEVVSLEKTIQTLKRRKPFLVHAHPSTMYALACYVKDRGDISKLFSIFESSGELLGKHQRELISNVMQCEVIDRYGLAEFGVVAYQLDGSSGPMQVLESECWVESAKLIEEGVEVQELVITNFHNQLMPLIRYRTGDHSLVQRNKDGVILNNIFGRVHELVPINGKIYTTHYIQDILDHRVGGIQEFQIDLRTLSPKLKIVPESSEQIEHISQKINQFWGNYFALEFVRHEDLNRVGRHAKFRRVVTA